MSEADCSLLGVSLAVTVFAEHLNGIPSQEPPAPGVCPVCASDTVHTHDRKVRAIIMSAIARGIDTVLYARAENTGKERHGRRRTRGEERRRESTSTGRRRRDGDVSV